MALDMSRRSVGAGFLSALVVLSAPAVLAQAESDGGSIGGGGPGRKPSAVPGCVVADPTPTPLNMRTAPNGQIIGTVENGTRVSILDSATSQKGEPWVYIADDQGKPMGWVYRRFINCR